MTAPAPVLWFVTGSQHLYGAEALKQVADNTAAVVAGLNASGKLAATVIAKPVMTTADDIRALMQQAGADASCAGLILWMHTFSPAKMWIGGLTALRKPFVHFHTQFNRDLPWSTIDLSLIHI
jgi:L-arabinose isomerase